MTNLPLPSFPGHQFIGLTMCTDPVYPCKLTMCTDPVYPCKLTMCTDPVYPCKLTMCTDPVYPCMLTMCTDPVYPCKLTMCTDPVYPCKLTIYLLPVMNQRPLIGQGCSILYAGVNLVCRAKPQTSQCYDDVIGTSDIQDWSRIADLFFPQLLDFKLSQNMVKNNKVQ